MICLENVSKVYRGRLGEIRALDAADLSVAKGEFVVVRGPSGSGKSTLLLTIAGMVRPTEGQVLVEGTDIYDLSSQQRARFRAQNVGFVFQMFHLVPYLSVLQNVLLPTRLIADGPGERDARALLERLGMSGRLDHKPGELSTGERQRTAVARALINQPWLVLADEPAGNLDPENSEQVLAYLSEFHSQGGTVVVVTHDASVESHAQRKLVLREGRLQSG